MNTPTQTSPSGTERKTPAGRDSASVAAPDSQNPASAGRRLAGKRVGMVMFSFYPSDPRPRRAADALIKAGASVELICLADEKSPQREILNGVDVRRVAVKHRRGGKFDYAYQYSAFILLASAILAKRSLKHRYDLIYVHNMPDVLVVSGLLPKLFGAKVVLDQHDPMPELMTTIFGLSEDSSNVRIIKRLEKWSLARANLVITVNVACQRIFSNRGCPVEKIGVVMNAPDGEIFPLRTPRSYPAPAVNDPNRPFVAMYHGSLVERNGVDLAVEAVGRLQNAIPGLELRIYGRTTPFLEQVMQQAKSKGLDSRVHYLGAKSLEDLVGEIERCDVGVIPNQRNPFTDINTPTRIFEYLALGKPVIAPSTPGILDYFGPESLFFFESGDAEDLAGKIMSVYSNPQRSMETAEQGQQVYLAHSWQAERQTLVNLVGGLFDEAGEARR